MNPNILVPRVWMPWQKVQEAPKRPAGRVGGGWIADIAAVRQCVLLCEFCQRKFHPKFYKYRVYKDYAGKGEGNCDVCKSFSLHLTAFIAEETYQQVIPERPHRGRWATWINRN